MDLNFFLLFFWGRCTAASVAVIRFSADTGEGEVPVPCARSSITHRFRRLEGVQGAHLCLSKVLTWLQGWLCWAHAAGGSGCTLTISRGFSAQTVVNYSCGRSRCKKLVLLCRGTTPCLAFENTNVRKQGVLPFWCINYKISWNSVDSFCLFWKQVNLLKLLTVAENRGVMSYTETQVWLNCNFHSTSALPLEKHKIGEERSFFY